jgi:hypothetical protein
MKRLFHAITFVFLCSSAYCQSVTGKQLVSFLRKKSSEYSQTLTEKGFVSMGSYQKNATMVYTFTKNRLEHLSIGGTFRGSDGRDKKTVYYTSGNNQLFTLVLNDILDNMGFTMVYPKKDPDGATTYSLHGDTFTIEISIKNVQGLDHEIMIYEN